MSFFEWKRICARFSYLLLVTTVGNPTIKTGRAGIPFIGLTHHIFVSVHTRTWLNFNWHSSWFHFVLSDLRWEVGVWFVEIGEMVIWSSTRVHLYHQAISTLIRNKVDKRQQCCLRQLKKHGNSFWALIF